MKNGILEYLLDGNNNPIDSNIFFDSTDHIRFQNGKNVSGHNYGCNRRFEIEKNVENDEGYTVTIYNLDGLHPLWQDNIQMAPKPMKIVSVKENIIHLRGFGYDKRAIAMGAPLEVASFSDYGIDIMIENNEIERIQLNMFDRNVSIVYLK